MSQPLVRGPGAGGGGGTSDATAANQSTEITSLQLIDDVVATAGTTTYTEGTTKAAVAGAVRRDANTSLVDTTNEVAPLQVNATGELKVAQIQALPAGSAIVGKVGIDQTTPGTTNLVSAAQSGTWTVQPGNTANTTAWKVDGSAVTQPVSLAVATADPFGLNADAASVSTSISAKLKGIATALGITAFDLGSGTGGSRTLRWFMDTAQWIGGAGAVTSAVQRITTASDDPVNTKLTSLISPGLSSSVSVTRPSDTTAYGAGDVVGVTGGGTATITFALGAVSGSRVMITGASLMRNVTALISGETSYTLHLYDVTQPGAQADNAVFDLVAGDRTAYLGSINLGTPVDLGSTLFVEQIGINKPIKLSGTSVFGVLVTVGAYTPASATVHVVTLHAVQL